MIDRPWDEIEAFEEEEARWLAEGGSYLYAERPKKPKKLRKDDLADTENDSPPEENA